MTIPGQRQPPRRVPRQADLRLDDDFIDLPLAAGGEARASADESVVAPPSQPRPRPRSWWWVLALVALLATAAAAGYYLSLSPPVAALAADHLDFGKLRLGAGGGELAIELHNRGEKKLVIDTAAMAGEALAEFAVVADGCSGQEVAPQSACALRLRFTPTARGVRKARLELFSNAVNGSVRLPLLGVGIEPELGFEPARLDFGEHIIGSASSAARLWLTNRGSANLAVRQVELDGLAAADFVGLADACSGSNLAPGGRCSVEYRFVPTSEGLRRAEVTIRSDSQQPDASPWLVGVGLPLEPILRLDPERLELGSWLVGEVSTPQTVEILNEGDGPLVVRRLLASMAEVSAQSSGSSTKGEPQPPTAGPGERWPSAAVPVQRSAEDVGFEVVTDNCSGQTVAPGQRCRIEIAFRPRQEGVARAFFEIEHSARQGLHALPVFGTGTAPRVAINPSKLSFGEIPVAMQSLPRVLRFVNSGTGPVRIRNLSVEGPDRRAFSPPASGCAAATLQPGAGCSIEVRFRPYRNGPHRAELVLRHSAGDGLHRLPVNGIGVSAKLTVDPARLDLGSVRVTADSQQSLDLSNRGRAAVEIHRLKLSGAYAGDFELRSDGCSATVLAPGGTCRVSVRFAPRSIGTRNATLEILHTSDGPREVPVTATATAAPRPEIRLSQKAFDFRDRRVGESSSTYTLRIENPGSGRLVLLSLRLAGAHPGDFHLTPGSCDGAAPVSPAGDCTVGLRFQPTAAGPRRAELVIRHNADASVHRVALDGLGAEPSP